jgi:hypothetical protein
MINQDAIEDLLNLSNPANMSGRKMFVNDGGNMMTAMNWFKKITGTAYLPPIPIGGPGGLVPVGAAREVVDKGVKQFGLCAHKEVVGLGTLTVCLRGGSSSTLDGAWGSPHHGPPTIEIFDARLLTLVPTCQPFLQAAKQVIVEIKFTTRADQTPVKVK